MFGMELMVKYTIFKLPINFFRLKPGSTRRMGLPCCCMVIRKEKAKYVSVDLRVPDSFTAIFLCVLDPFRTTRIRRDKRMALRGPWNRVQLGKLKDLAI